MKLSIAVCALLSSVAVTAFNPLLGRAAKCNADNCARAVTGTVHQASATDRMADCASFMHSTMTPSPIWKTVTVEHPMTGMHMGMYRPNHAITESPSAMPDYAESPCSSSAQYVSACSCAGAKGKMSTAPTPTYTVTRGPHQTD